VVPPLVEHSDAVRHNPFEVDADVKVQSLKGKLTNIAVV